MTEQNQNLHNQSQFTITILPWIVCVLAALFYCYEFFLRVAPSVMVPQLMGAYHIGAKDFGMLTAAYYYIYTPMQFPVGVLMDRYGPRRLLTLTIILCALGSFLMGGVLTIFAGAVGRFLMGFGSAFAFVGVLKLAVQWLPPKRLALVSGIATTLGMIGAILADDALTAMVGAIGWRASWYYAGFFGIVLAVVVWFVVRDRPPHKRKKMMKQETRTWRQAWYYLTHIACNPQIWVNGLIGGFMFLPITVFGALWGVSFLTQTYHMSSINAGNAVSMMFWGVAVGGPIMGWLSDCIKRRRLILQFGTLGGAILMGLVLLLPGWSYLMVYVFLFLVGFMVSAEVLVFAIGSEISPHKAAGTAIAGTNFLVMIGGAIFQPIAGWILSLGVPQKVVQGVSYYAYKDYVLALMVLPIGLLVGFFLTFLLRETHCEPQVSEEGPRGHWPKMVAASKRKGNV